MRISDFNSIRERMLSPYFGCLRCTVKEGSGWRENKYRQVIDDLSSRGIGRNEWRRGISFTISETVILKGHLWTVASETNPQKRGNNRGRNGSSSFIRIYLVAFKSSLLGENEHIRAITTNSVKDLHGAR